MDKREWPDKTIDKAPYLCSVDLRDGNQALPDPMNIDEKLKLFKLLTDIGFKEIEIGYPAASQVEFDLIRRLIEEDLIPDGVFIQVLIPCIEKYIIRSVESLQGAKNVILHIYNSTSILQRKVTFKMSKEEIKDIAINGARLLKKYADDILTGTNVVYQYSPESFSDTETDYALEVCEAVMEELKPTEEGKLILNLPETVQWAGPHVFADQIEWFIKHMKHPERAIISVHTHNDRGTGVASAELAMLAGAQRVEGTLFGNGERTGNLDILTLVLNMYSDGIDLPLDLSNMPRIKKIYQDVTKMQVPVRHPYAGEYVFTAFSGSHQDAIKKGMDMRKESGPDSPWEVPYLPIDPKDIGRTYEAIIRINSQSGKGGVAYILQTFFNYQLPKKMHPEVGHVINKKSDQAGRELTPEEIIDIFEKTFVNVDGILSLEECKIFIDNHLEQSTTSKVKIIHNGEKIEGEGSGNGPINAFSNVLEEKNLKNFELLSFGEQSIEKGSDSKAVCYIQIKSLDKNQLFWGVGLDDNISLAGIKALISAYNRAASAE